MNVEPGIIIMWVCAGYVVLHILVVVKRRNKNGTSEKPKEDPEIDTTTSLFTTMVGTKCQCERSLEKKDYRFVKFIKIDHEINNSKTGKTPGGDDVIMGYQVRKCISCGKKYVHHWNLAPTNRREFVVSLEKFLKTRDTNGGRVSHGQYDFGELEP